MSVSETSPKLTFLTIPLEIRTKIYKLVLDGHEPPAKYWPMNVNTPPLLCVNKQIEAEASADYYKQFHHQLSGALANNNIFQLNCNYLRRVVAAAGPTPFKRMTCLIPNTTVWRRPHLLLPLFELMRSARTDLSENGITWDVTARDRTEIKYLLRRLTDVARRARDEGWSAPKLELMLSGTAKELHEKFSRRVAERTTEGKGRKKAPKRARRWQGYRVQLS